MAMKLAITPPEVSSPKLSSVADEIGQPAHDLLLDERAGRPRMPHVDALVGHLGKHLASDRHRNGGGVK